MKYLKQFESFFDETELKKLNQHLINVITEFGYRQTGYIDNGWETEFDIDSKLVPIFKIKLNINNFTNKLFIQLEVNSLLIDTFAQNFIKYLNQIKGIKFIREERTSLSNYAYFKIFDKDVDKIISRISKEDLDQFTLNNKFNI